MIQKCKLFDELMEGIEAMQRDGFASLKKTCRKLGISFWGYPGDRIGQHGEIAPLPDIIRERAAAARAVP